VTRFANPDLFVPFVDRPGAYEAAQAAIERGDLEIFYVHTTLEEAAATPDLERRVRLLLVLITLGKLVLSSGILADISRFDQAGFTDDAGAATLDALGSKNLAKHGWDALAASTALNSGWALVTNETKRLPNRAREQGIEVLNTDDLLREIKHTP
jgi:hypothetical protein